MQLVHGSRDIPQWEALIRLVPSGSDATFSVTRSPRPRRSGPSNQVSIALGVFGAIAALATLAIVVIAISRQLRSTDEELQVLRVLGASPTTTVADAGRSASWSRPGLLLAIVVAISLSPLSPLGPIREGLDHPPRHWSDRTVLGFGALVLIGGSA